MPHSSVSDPDRQVIEPTIASTSSCCSLQKFAMPVLSTITIIAVCAAVFYAGRASQIESLHENAFHTLPLVNASASANVAEKYSIATGQVSEDSEGFFVLDHNSGLLQCNVIYPRTGRFMAQFSVNVGDALGTTGKGGDYIIVTGSANFPRASNRPIAPTIVYVLDAKSGNYACYGIPFDRQAGTANRAQQRDMFLINTGSASAVPDRDKLR